MKDIKGQFQNRFHLFTDTKLNALLQLKADRIQRWFRLLYRQKFSFVVILITKELEKSKAYQGWHQLAIEAGIKLLTISVSTLESRNWSYRQKVKQQIDNDLNRGHGVLVHDGSNGELVEWLLSPAEIMNDSLELERKSNKFFRRISKPVAWSAIQTSLKVVSVSLLLTLMSHVLIDIIDPPINDKRAELNQLFASIIDRDLAELNQAIVAQAKNQWYQEFDRRPYLSAVATFLKNGNQIKLDTINFSKPLAADLLMSDSDLEYWVNANPELLDPPPELPVYRFITYKDNYQLLIVSIWTDPGDRILIIAISPEVLFRNYRGSSTVDFVLMDGRAGYYSTQPNITIENFMSLLEAKERTGSAEIRTLNSIWNVKFSNLEKSGLTLFSVQSKADFLVRLNRLSFIDLLFFIFFVLPVSLVITRQFHIFSFFKNQSRTKLILNAVIAFLWCGSAIALVGYFNNYYSKIEVQAGYLNRNVEHRKKDQLTWTNVVPNQFLPEGELLRTDAKGEVVILLDKNIIVEVDPNSSIALPSSNQTTNQNPLSVLRGSVLITAGNNGSLIKLGNQLLNLKSGSMRIFVDPSLPKSAEVEAGESSIIEAESGNLVLQSDEVLLIQDNNWQKIRRRIRPIAPPDNQRLFILGDEIDVEFRWIGPDANTHLEIYDNNLFQIAVKNCEVKIGQEKRCVVRLPVGNYYWQIKQEEKSSMRRLQILRRDNPTLFLPRHDTTLIGSNFAKSNYVEFRWKADEHSSTYFMEVAKDRGFTDRVFFDTVQKNSISLVLAPGRYYWRILTKSIVPAAESESSISSFQLVYNDSQPKAIDASDSNIAKNQEAENPLMNTEPIEPVGIIDMTNKKVLTFRWKGDPNIERTLMLKDENGAFILQSKVTGNIFTLTDVTALDEGVYHWSLESDKESVNAQFIISQY